MDLTWIAVAIAGCVGLALCLVVVLLAPMAHERRRLRPLANVGRLTELPEFVSAVRRRLIATLVTIALLVVAFAGAIVTGARPTGLPTAADESASLQPEDVILCIGGPTTDPAVTAALTYFAQNVPTFGTERVGLTSTNRRVVPLTRDYTYAAGQFAAYAQPEAAGGLVAPVSYVDYAGGVEDTLALCFTGFPNFEERSAQRRSVVYVGPAALREPDEQRPELFTADAVTAMATAAGVQVNVLVTGQQSDAMDSLARDTGGQSFVGDAAVAEHLTQIRDAPPTAVAVGDAVVAPTETPDIPLLLALLAVVALAAWPVVLRR